MDEPLDDLPHGLTARRLEWVHLPPHVRRLVEQRCGTAVVDARSCTGGFTPGFASVLRGADGSRHYVKAASVTAQRASALTYAAEAASLAALDAASLPAPRLLWSHGTEPGRRHRADDWVVVGIEHVAARAPYRPWRATDLAAVLGTLDRLAVSPAATGVDLTTVAEDLADWPARWADVAAARPDLDRAHVREATGLAAALPTAVAGHSLVHGDVTDDNVLMTEDGRVLLCGWAWPALGAPWLDSLWALVGPRSDGVDVEAVLRSTPLLAAAPAEHVDTVLAATAAYFLSSAQGRSPAWSPYLRLAQRRQGEACWAWLGERRGWWSGTTPRSGAGSRSEDLGGLVRR
ncbi:aminoglycoside phosphotransferase (APT) family kinase protein [Nocardioides marinisabuli]|uniref:Aminoglycoside phosphotransferase (APT) family kinase protein n=1 Tax=Nocardioides marinisabuli TaxID=419476 RepID=A0A7Y9F4J1_9ACTN|nr:phosphotransferase [Nocardioides marinisabuli]NYD59519.1 aminoglycoside phosphotransferase (APT) family kinase protein [Nocardioides marinisabuli]